MCLSTTLAKHLAKLRPVTTKHQHGAGLIMSNLEQSGHTLSSVLHTKIVSSLLAKGQSSINSTTLLPQVFTHFPKLAHELREMIVNNL